MASPESIITELERTRTLSEQKIITLLTQPIPEDDLFRRADQVRRRVYGDAVYIRGLIEVSNYCRNNCYYCGIRCGNTETARYRLSQEEILACCREGYALGFRTFVLQGGEDPAMDDTQVCRIVEAIRAAFPDCAITLSLGEKERASYLAFYRAGANRYLLRHESANEELYRKLHPSAMSLKNRKRCLYDLKEIGYQVGAGFMVGAPCQTPKHLAEDLRFLQELQPDMIGIGPFLHHHQTPFREEPDGSAALTLRLIAVLRLMFPHALIPATTALNSIAPTGREQGLRAGANVVMPNLSPTSVRELYALYDNKASFGAEAAESLALLKEQIAAAGYRVVTDRGDVRRAIDTDSASRAEHDAAAKADNKQDTPAVAERWARSRALMGDKAIEALANAHVAVFGLGGVGGMAAEALVRSGVGALDLIDGDTVSVTNLNRQIFATEETVGMPKTDAAIQRLHSINPAARLRGIPMLYTPETADTLPLDGYDYIIDAIDMVTAKIELVLRAERAGVPIISAMGAGNKLDPSAFQVADIYQTSVCPLARVMRRELKARGVRSLKVVYSKEPPYIPSAKDENGQRVPASCAFVPPAAGLVLAGEVVRELAALPPKKE